MKILNICSQTDPTSCNIIQHYTAFSNAGCCWTNFLVSFKRLIYGNFSRDNRSARVDPVWILSNCEQPERQSLIRNTFLNYCLMTTCMCAAYCLSNNVITCVNFSLGVIPVTKSPVIYPTPGEHRECINNIIIYI